MSRNFLAKSIAVRIISKGTLFWVVNFFFVTLPLVFILWAVNLPSIALNYNKKVVDIPSNTEFIMPYRQRSAPMFLFRLNGILYQAACIQDMPCNKNYNGSKSYYENTKFNGREIKYLEVFASSKYSRGVFISGKAISLTDGQEYSLYLSQEEISFITNRMKKERFFLWLTLFTAIFAMFFSFFGLILCLKFNED